MSAILRPVSSMNTHKCLSRVTSGRLERSGIKSCCIERAGWVDWLLVGESHGLNLGVGLMRVMAFGSIVINPTTWRFVCFCEALTSPVNELRYRPFSGV